MFSKSRRSSSKKRSRKNRFTKSFSIESLERREMFAANLATEIGIAFTVKSDIDSQPAAVASLMTLADSRTVADTNRLATDGLRDQLNSDITSLPVNVPMLGATFEDGVLTVSGSNVADHISIFASEGTVYVREVVKRLTLLAVPEDELVSISVESHGGDDWVNVDHGSINVPATLQGGSGNDTLQGGAGADGLYGDAGSDKLFGHEGGDYLGGGLDNDLLVGLDGNDNLYGSDGDDYLVGAAGDDWLHGEAGNDVVFGEGGNDFLFGGDGQDLLDGGAGNDAIYGGGEGDDIYGGEGDDFIMGLSGDDRIRGEAGNDKILAGDGDDIVDGGEGDDEIRGEEGNDALGGGAGNDVIAGGAGQDWLDGGAGNDWLRGEDGDDWLQGAGGYDLLNGGMGDDLIFEEYAEGAEPTGQLASALSWGDVEDAWEDTVEGAEDFAGDVGEVLTDIAEWTVDTAITIGGLYYNWLVNLDDRVMRLGADLVTTFSNWPWEAEFWHGLGAVLIDSLEIVGFGEAWQLYCAYYMPWLRGLTDAEIEVARSVFGDSIEYYLVRRNEYSLMNEMGSVLSGMDVEAHVTGYIINSNGDISNETLVHELTHIWQYEEDGLIYMPEALGSQNGGAGYEYGGVDDLREKMAAGKGLWAYNREQQGDIVGDYYELREELRSTSATGSDLAAMHSDLDVYIHFVKEVSTLSAAELDVPQATGSPSLDSGLPSKGDSILESPTAGATMPTMRGDASQVTDLAAESTTSAAPASATSTTSSTSLLLATTASDAAESEDEEAPAVVASAISTSDSGMVLTTASTGSLSTSPVTTRARDAVFASLA